ncbi:hypothetical protein HK104_005819 [Borealophlyctis nickersoniae]|nr:hypothetical protein HK104_005819 [Borealophlyctis nickersoniae]
MKTTQTRTFLLVLLSLLAFFSTGSQAWITGARRPAWIPVIAAAAAVDEPSLAGEASPSPSPAGAGQGVAEAQSPEAPSDETSPTVAAGIPPAAGASQEASAAAGAAAPSPDAVEPTSAAAGAVPAPASEASAPTGSVAAENTAADATGSATAALTVAPTLAPVVPMTTTTTSRMLPGPSPLSVPPSSAGVPKPSATVAALNGASKRGVGDAVVVWGLLVVPAVVGGLGV